MHKRKKKRKTRYTQCFYTQWKKHMNSYKATQWHDAFISCLTRILRSRFSALLSKPDCLLAVFTSQGTRHCPRVWILPLLLWMFGALSHCTGFSVVPRLVCSSSTWFSCSETIPSPGSQWDAAPRRAPLCPSRSCSAASRTPPPASAAARG